MVDLNQYIESVEETIRLAAERLDVSLWQGIYDARVGELKAMQYLFRRGTWETFRANERALVLP